MSSRDKAMTQPFTEGVRDRGNRAVLADLLASNSVSRESSNASTLGFEALRRKVRKSHIAALCSFLLLSLAICIPRLCFAQVPEAQGTCVGCGGYCKYGHCPSPGCTGDSCNHYAGGGTGPCNSSSSSHKAVITPGRAGVMGGIFGALLGGLLADASISSNSSLTQSSQTTAQNRSTVAAGATLGAAVGAIAFYGLAKLGQHKSHPASASQSQLPARGCHCGGTSCKCVWENACAGAEFCRCNGGDCQCTQKHCSAFSTTSDCSGFTECKSDGKRHCNRQGCP